MSKKRYLIGVLLVFSSPVHAKPQQHAPTLETCRADRAVWYNSEMSTEYMKAETARVSDGMKNRTPSAKLPLAEIITRHHEMADCQAVDPGNSDAYRAATEFYYGIYTDRCISFIVRHNLMEQLRKEDAEGLR